MNLIRCYAKISDAIATASCVLGPDGGGALSDIPGVREVRVHKPHFFGSVLSD
jgi:hypothetical protein